MLLTTVLAVVTVAVVAMLIRDVLSGPPRPFAWAMFTQAGTGEFHLVTENGERLDPYWYLPNQSVRFHALRIEDFLDFLDSEHGIRPSGYVLLADGEVCWRVEVVAGNMVRVADAEASENSGVLDG